MSDKTDIVAELVAADAYNAKHYERDPLHRKAAAEIRALRSALRECSDDLAKRAEREKAVARVPVCPGIYERAMEPVNRARALLTPTEER